MIGILAGPSLSWYAMVNTLVPTEGAANSGKTRGWRGAPSCALLYNVLFFYPEFRTPDKCFFPKVSPDTYVST